MAKPKDKEQPTEMGLRMKAAREAAGLTREEVVEAVRRLTPDTELSVRTIYRYEKRMVPGTKRLVELATVYGTTMHWLATGEAPAEAAS